ncbi:MAG: hypothetical protein QGG64_12605, partial [Candidatus Latescibacteria bacterium]|nr:hypothetical protein [Candidatus Latescibacterota bacterium]
MQLRVKSKGHPLTLDPNDVLGAGGEAKVFLLPKDPKRVAKVYHKPTKTHAQKLSIMLANPPGDPMANQGHISIAWPVDLLQTTNGNQEVVGFLMPNIKDMNSILNFYNPQVRHQTCPLVNYQYLHRTARNLATSVGALHKRGYVIGDINESNILVSDTSRVTLVDTDSFQVSDPQTGQIYRCPVGKPEFTPPELQGISFSQIDRQPQHDLFGLAVLLFQLLMEGFHPFTGIYKDQGDPPPVEKRIASGHFPYSKKWRIPYDPSPVSPDINMLHPDLKWLFFRCFETGHKRPKRRPDANAWVQALEKAEQSLVECAQNEQHLYSKHLRNCPWCERTSRLNGRDPFPSPQAIQQGLPKRPSPPAHTPLPPRKPAKKPAMPAPSASVSQTASAPSVTSKRSSKKWLVGLAFLLCGYWLTTQSEYTLPDISLPKFPELTMPDFPDFTLESPPEKTNAQEHKPAPRPSPPLQLEEQQSLSARFEELNQPGLPTQTRIQLCEKFVDDFRYHPKAESYIRQVKNEWEQMAYSKMSNVYNNHQIAPTTKSVNALLAAAKTYLQHHDKRGDTATETLRLAQWHLNMEPHPLTLYIDQEKKLYVKVIYNGAVYTETKNTGRFASVSLPQHKSTDTVWIESYQDDRFDD